MDRNWRNDDLVDELLEQGLFYFGADKVESAISAWRRVLYVAPNEPRALDYLEAAGAEPTPEPFDVTQPSVIGSGNAAVVSNLGPTVSQSIGELPGLDEARGALGQEALRPQANDDLPQQSSDLLWSAVASKEFSEPAAPAPTNPGLGTSSEVAFHSSDSIDTIRPELFPTPPPLQAPLHIDRERTSPVARPLPRSQWSSAAPRIAVLVGVLAVAVVAVLIVQGQNSPADRTATAEPSAAQPAAAATAQPADEAGARAALEQPAADSDSAAAVPSLVDHFIVRLRVEPSDAKILVDGEPAGVGALAKRFPLDGRMHEIVVRAPGHLEQRYSFSDTAPPALIVLEREKESRRGNKRARKKARTKAAALTEAVSSKPAAVKPVAAKPAATPPAPKANKSEPRPGQTDNRDPWR